MKRFALLICAILTAAGPVSGDVPDCEALAERAALDEGIPPGLMTAIARVESGRTVQGRFRAWPWTLNNAGNGSYHPDKDTALAALDQMLASGIRNVDIGCMQINWRWHSGAFGDAASMMDPVENTRYAARFLRALHDRHGDWTQAVEHYHSSDPERGRSYAQRVDRHLPEDPTDAGDNRLAQAAPVHAARGLVAGGGRGSLLAPAAGALVTIEAQLNAGFRYR